MGKPQYFAATMELPYPMTSGILSAFNPVAAGAVTEMMAESAKFMSERMNATVALQQDIMASPSDALALQTAYLQDTMQACTAEMTRYADLVMTSFGAIAEDARTGHKRAYNDVPV